MCFNCFTEVVSMAARIEKPSGDGEKAIENGEKNVLLKKIIVNKLNLLNFFDKGIHCHMDQRGEKGDLTVNLKPLPSFGKYLVCLWPEELAGDADPATYRMKNISIPDTSSDINIVPEIRRLTSKGFCVRLPDQCEIKNHSFGDNSMFSDMKVRINQNNVSVACDIAELKDNTLAVSLSADSLFYFSHFDSSLKVNVAFVKEGEILFTGQYMIKKREDMHDKHQITLKPESQMINRFPPKKFRSNRENLKPSPDVIFTHPFTGRQITMVVRDLSGSGFSVNSGNDESLLLTGMVIRNMRLSFAGVFTLSCSAQVVHRRAEPAIRDNSSADAGQLDENRTLVYGFALIDMPLTDHLKLQSIMQQCENNHFKVCNSLNPDELWHFFFETGFIYSKKYRSFIENKDLIRDTYIKLYSQKLDIARHFTYLEKGEILGHLSMLRFYENAWLIHHHAALKKSNIKAGLAVLNQVAKFSYNSIWLETCHMRYMFCYFRPENAFPDYFFNGFAERLNDKNGCSTDPFAYYSFKKPAEGGQNLPQGWKIGNSTPLDLEDLRSYYMKKSGGLMIDALDLSPDSTSPTELESAYQKAGLTREKHLLSLRYHGDLAAVILVNIADIAINMSDLTSSLTMMVLREDLLTRDILNTALMKLSAYFTQKRFPVLLYPLSYAKDQAIPFKKTYILWILATRYSDHYFEYLDHINMLGSGKH